MARASKVRVPSARPVNDGCAEQGSHAAGWIRHSKVAPGSEAVSVKAAPRSATMPVGPPPIVVTGGVVSTVHVHQIVSWAPPDAVARTPNVCWPEATVKDG